MQRVSMAGDERAWLATAQHVNTDRMHTEPMHGGTRRNACSKLQMKGSTCYRGKRVVKLSCARGPAVNGSAAAGARIREIVARAARGDSQPADDRFRLGKSCERFEDAQRDPNVVKWPGVGNMHPEMLPEHALVQEDELWEEGWYGINTRWWTELSNYEEVEMVCVLLFGVGTGQEGVYSLQRWTEDGLPHDTVLAFASVRDAERYAALLEEEMGRMAVVEPISPPDLEVFCQDAGFDIRVVDSSAVMLGLFIPPKQTVEVTDWERASRLRDGRWSVLPGEPTFRDAALSDLYTLTEDGMMSKLVNLGAGRAC